MVVACTNFNQPGKFIRNALSAFLISAASFPFSFLSALSAELMQSSPQITQFGDNALPPSCHLENFAYLFIPKSVLIVGALISKLLSILLHAWNLICLGAYLIFIENASLISGLSRFNLMNKPGAFCSRQAPNFVFYMQGYRHRISY